MAAAREVCIRTAEDGAMVSERMNLGGNDGSAAGELENGRA